MVEHSFTFAEALQAVWPTNIFTTHTPVPAGNERFGLELMEKYFRTWAQQLGMSGRISWPWAKNDPMTKARAFALRYSRSSSLLTRMASPSSMESYLGKCGLAFGRLSPRRSTDLFHHERRPSPYLGFAQHARASRSILRPAVLRRAREPRHVGPPGSDIRRGIVANARAPPGKVGCFCQGSVKARDEALWSRRRSPSSRRRRPLAFAITISFARRFATYKRGNLLLRDPDRLLRLISDPQRPVQIIFAGKAHPHDLPGKEIIKELVHFSRREEVQSRIIFLEDYDMTMARYLTSGSDVWLNTPRRPLEASGTSGMKAGVNGVLNCSILDGWWAEGYGPEVGWAIGSGEEYQDEELQDRIESEALYDLLEHEIVPLFYQRGRDGLPREWIKRMKASMKSVGQRFSTHRMLKEYSERFYFPALDYGRRLAAGKLESAKELAAYLAKAHKAWPAVEISELRADAKPIMERGDSVTVSALVDLGGLEPSEAAVELYHGPVTIQDGITSAARDEMTAIERKGKAWEYRVTVVCNKTGQHGYAIRVLPKHPALVSPYVPGLIRWA